MRLWTIQTVEVYNKILENGIHYCDEELSMWLEIDCFVNAYNWMRKKMEEKIGNSEVKYPIWAWYAYNGKNRKPDLRRLGYAEKGTKLVCLEIEVDENKVLLSDFDLWHCVLNDCFVSDDDAQLDEFYTLSEDKQDKLKKESWDKIIVKKDEDIPKDAYIQATFFELRKEDIKKVQFFTAK